MTLPRADSTTESEITVGSHGSCESSMHPQIDGSKSCVSPRILPRSYHILTDTRITVISSRNRMDLFEMNRFVGDEANNRAEESQLILDRLHKKAEERKRQRRSGGQTPGKRQKRQHEHEAGPTTVGVETGPGTADLAQGTQPDSRQGHGGGVVERMKGLDVRSAGGGDRGGGTTLPGDDGAARKRGKKKKKEKQLKSSVVDGSPHDDSGIEWPEIPCPETPGPDDDGSESPEGISRSRKKKRKASGRGGHEDAADVHERELAENDPEMVMEESIDSTPSKKIKKKSKKQREDRTDSGNANTGLKTGEDDQSISGGDSKGGSTTSNKKKKPRGKRNKTDTVEQSLTEKTTEAEEAGGDEEEMEGEMFPVLGDFTHEKKEKVARVLPEWLARPTKISSDIEHHSVSRDTISGLDARILTALDEMKISSFFPVQAKVIPLVLQSAKRGVFIGPAGYRPGDLCVAAPTGSGKTLAFTIPIVQLLMDRVVQRLRALIVLPTKDLAAQVFRVFLQLTNKTPLKVVMIGGQRTLKEEGSLLVNQSMSGQYLSAADIVVSTPGRLVDHINHTKGFSLRHLRFLVIDEADNLMVQHSKDWITRVEREIEGSRGPSQEITVESEARMEMPFQKLLFSATLSHNPEHLIHFKLFQPRLVSSVTSHDQELANGETGKSDKASTAKYVTPASLEEYYMVCDISDKPMLVIHLLKNLGCTQVLCFTNSVEASHRLYLLMTKMAGIQVGEFSSKLSGAQRQSMIKQFKNETIQLLICSDVMARGMDLSNVNYVVSYDAPLHLKTYIHRVGRTARAGRKGTAYTILLENEVGKFERIVGKSSATGIKRVTVSDEELKPFVEDYRRSLKHLPQSLKDEIYQRKNR